MEEYSIEVLGRIRYMMRTEIFVKSRSIGLKRRHAGGMRSS